MKKLRVFFVAIAMITLTSSAPNGGPGPGEVVIVGTGPYLIQHPTPNGGLRLIYCRKWRALFHLWLHPEDLCISLICPNDPVI